MKNVGSAENVDKMASARISKTCGFGSNDKEERKMDTLNASGYLLNMQLVTVGIKKLP